MSPIEPVEIVLDKPRHLRFDHMALFDAEKEMNKVRGAIPSQHLSIDAIVVKAVGEHLLQVGFFPRDLLMVLLWAGLKHEEKSLTLERVGAILDETDILWSDVSRLLWEAYHLFAGKNIVEKKEGSAEEPDPDQRPGANSGASGGLH